MPASLAQKLQIKPGQLLALSNTPPGYQETLAREMPDNTVVSMEGSQPVGALLLFVNNLDEVRSLAPQAFRQMGPDGLLWLAYPKGSSKVKTDVNRDRLWEALTSSGWRPVRQISIDETWSAIRFRPEDRVGSK